MPSRAQLLESLRSDPQASPAEIRRRALQVVREIGETEGALWYAMAEVEGQPTLVEWERLDMDDRPMQRMRDERLGWPHADPRRPPWPETHSFHCFSMLAKWETIARSPMFQRIFLDHRLDDQLRLLVYSGDRFIGWVGGFRTHGSPGFRRADARRLNAFSDAIASALVQADAAERAARIEESCDLLLRPDGHVEYASAAARVWLAKAEHRDLARRWTRILEREGMPPRHLAGWPLRWSRLCGSGGTRYLLHLSPPNPILIRPLDRLTERQREVAQLAAAGATIPEIARMVERSRETVRTHLREVYRRLDVSSRAELAQVVAGTE